MWLISSDHEIISTVREQLGKTPPTRLGVAVSGGGDSVALLHILSRCFNSHEVQLHAVTVDHGLRAGSAQEAHSVAQMAASLGIAHSVLRWENWDGSGNLQDQARRARYRLLGAWAAKNDITTLLLGHTANDQAETVLMRLGRTAGVDGLAAIPVRRLVDGVTVVRPLMGLTRVQLRDYLTRQGIEWVDDPSNEDTRFDRIKARKLLDLLEPLGVTADGLAHTAENMASARDALDWYCFLAAREVTCVDGGNVVLDLRKFRTLPDETARRLLVRAVTWVASLDYPPRRGATMGALNALRQGEPATLGGCHAFHVGGAIWLCREYNAVRASRCDVGQVWDQRWRIIGSVAPEIEVRALGREGLAQCPNWRDTQRPAAALTGTPSLWHDGALISAPIAGFSAGYCAEMVDGGDGFYSSILSH